jgi:PTH2 family peptidyl-tRNA hydrolase
MKDRKEIEPKQVIVIRKDLNMSAGKLAAQTAHASGGNIFSKFKRTKTGDRVNYSFDLDLKEELDNAFDKWLNERFTKIIVYVKSEEALKNIYQKALDKNLPAVLIKDAGFTEFSEPTLTCVGIGPAYPDDFIGITSKLRLFDGQVIAK